MSADDSQEKTEQATSRKKQQSREKGQVLRSRELSTFLIVIVGALTTLFLGKYVAFFFINVFYTSFQVDSSVLMDASEIIKKFIVIKDELTLILLKFLGSIFLASFIAPLAMGGWNFSIEALVPKFNKLNPINGFKRMFSMHGIMEMIKALGKFILIAAISVLVIGYQATELKFMSTEPVKQAILHSVLITGWAFLFVSAGLIVISFIDVPFQIWNHNKQLKMSKQEVKEEYKDIEGKPEIKSRIRSMQREIAQSRMMSKIPEADVIITNPTHYAVALRYKPNNDSVPVVVAKGKNLVAERIKEVAGEYELIIVESASLTRSVYYSTEIGQEIPAGLYVAVAQVLAYVYQIKEYKKGKMPKPSVLSDLPIPEELRRDV